MARESTPRGARRSGPGLSVLGMASILVVVVVLVAAMYLTISSGTTSPGSPATTSILSFALRSACEADTRVVDSAIATYQANDALRSSTQVTRTELTAPATGTLQSWPANRAYAITIAGDGSPYPARATGDSIHVRRNDVIVTVTSTHMAYDSTQDPNGACSTL